MMESLLQSVRLENIIHLNLLMITKNEVMASGLEEI